MKICIPISLPEGLVSRLESDLSQAQYLHFYDLEERSFEEIDLRAHDAESVPIKDFDAVICPAVHRQVFKALRHRGVRVFLSEAETVQEALDEFAAGKSYMIPDEVGGCSGGCGGHGMHDHGHDGCQCHSDSSEACSGGCGGHEEESHHGCGCAGRHHGEVGARRQRGDGVRIAVTSQNRKTVTEHAGKCRKFWIYETRVGQVVGKSLLELPLEQSLHAWNSEEKHPLQGVDVLITASAGDGMRSRLAGWGIETVLTAETDPDAVVETFLST